MARTKSSTLYARVGYINEALFGKGKTEAWEKKEDGSGWRSVVGMFELESNLLGYQLMRVSTDGGGVSIMSGYHKAGEMLEILNAWIKAIEITREVDQLKTKGNQEK